MTNINTFQGDVFIPEYIKHSGDDNNLFGFSGTDTFKIATAGADAIKVDASQNVDITGLIRHIGDENNLFGFSGTDTFKIATAGSDRLTVADSGRVSISHSLDVPDYIYHTGDDNTYFGFYAADSFKIATAGADAMTVQSNGNVGMGTATSDNRLHIYNNVDNVGYVVENNARTFTLGIRGDTSDVFAITDDTAGAFRMTVQTNGNVGIGTAASDNRLHIYNNADNVGYVVENNARTFTMGIRGDTSDSFAITDDTAGAFRMSITSSGLVAIGSHTPNRTLDVNGSCTFRSVAFGERFTSYFHNTGQLNSIQNYDIALTQFQLSSTSTTHSPTTGWYLLSAQRGDGNPFESGSAHFYYYPSSPQRMTTFGQGGISFTTASGVVRMATSQNAASFPTPYAIHLTKIGNTYALGV